MYLIFYIIVVIKNTSKLTFLKLRPRNQLQYIYDDEL